MPRPLTLRSEARGRAPAGEAARKLVHVAASLAAAAVVWRMAHPAGAVILAAATGVALSVELARQISPAIQQRFLATVGWMLRGRELRRTTAATTLALGFTLCATFFPGPAATAILLVGLADPAAALVGRRWGAHRYHGGKSLEGSLTFLVTAFVVLYAGTGLSTPAAALVAAGLALLESLPLPGDDNLYLPLAAGGLLTLLGGAGGAGIFS
jgi:dolichol kinase